MVLKRVRLKKVYLAIVPHLFLFTDTYRMVNFHRMFLQLNTIRLWGNSDVIFEFLESKNIPRGISNARSYFKQKLSKKMQYLAGHSPIINFSFFKNAIKSEPLGVRDQYFQDFHISMVPTTGKSFKKIHGWHALDDLTWNYPMKHLPMIISNRCYDQYKKVFYPFLEQELSGNIFLHQNHAAYQSKL